MASAPVPIKKHGRLAWSLFTLGLHTLRKLLTPQASLNNRGPRPILVPKHTHQILRFWLSDRESGTMVIAHHLLEMRLTMLHLIASELLASRKRPG
jgi:hypothetical protein